MTGQFESKRVCCGPEQNDFSDRENAAFGSIQRIERTIRFMTENLDRPLQASELAAVANMSLSHYFALFKRATGCPPIDYFIRLRMNRARLLLETTSLNIKEISSALGYEDPFYFSRLFKSVAGLAPTDYRRAYHGAADLDPGRVRSDSSLKAVWTNGRRERAAGTKEPPSAQRVELFDAVQLSSTTL